MPLSSLATLRQVARLKKPNKAATTVRSLHNAVTGLLIASAFAPLAAFTSKTPKARIPAGQPAGLIVMLHGCNQTPDDFATGTHMNAPAEKHGLAVAYPAQTRQQNAASCWNWFKPGHQYRGMGEPAILASLMCKLMREFGLGRPHVQATGPLDYLSGGR